MPFGALCDTKLASRRIAAHRGASRRIAAHRGASRRIAALREYEDEQGRSPFGRWFDGLAAPAALKVRTALARLEGGNTSALKSVGKGVHEARIDFGPGHRVYVGQDGAELVILLGGGAKARQDRAIADAQARWADYKARKRRG